MKPKQHILIVLIAGIGDLILASRAMRVIRNGFPDAEIHLITSSDASPIAKNYDFLSKVWNFPIREMRKSKRYIFHIIKVLLSLRKIKFQEVINLYMIGSFTGAVKMGLLFLFIKSRLKIGHNAHGFGLFLTKKLPPQTFIKRHFSDAMMDIAILAGGIPDEKGIEVFWDKSCENMWNELFREKEKDNHKLFIGINPGGDRLNKRWDLKRYAFVADRLIEQFNAKILLLGGPGEESLSQKILSEMKHSAVNLSGKLSLNDLVYIISQLNLLLTNDSGPMHIGAATKTPLVALFGPEDPVLMGPYGRQKLFRVMYKNLYCSPCQTDKCKQPDCMNLITPEEVFEKCIEVLKINYP